jgi:DNA ligase-1
MKKILDGEFISFLEGIEGDFVIDGQVWSPHLSAGEGFRMILPLVKTKTLTKEFKTDRKFVFTVFDIVQYKRESLQSRTYISRRAKLHQLKFTKYMSEIVPLKTIDDLELYLQGLKNTYFEGLILKKKDSIYQPGKRSRDWLKVKSSFENLDVKVISYAKGTGKYKQIYSTFEVAVLDNKELKSIGHVGSGFKQIDYEELQKLISENKQIVIEVECEAITKSEKYSSGFGLRFPRFKRLRLQKTYPDSLETVKKIFSIK